MQSIFEEIVEERKRQNTKWGQQDHPSIRELSEHLPEAQAHYYEIPTEERAKSLCNVAFDSGVPTYAHIAVEELSEVVGAADEIERRKELVQLAAVVVQWIQNIDRSNKTQMEVTTQTVRERALQVVINFHPHATGIQNAEIHESQELINDLDFDSLDLIELIMEQEKEFSMFIPDTEAEKVVTVKDLLDLIESKVK